MWNYIGIIRNEKDMNLMLRKIEKLKIRLFKIGKNIVNTRFLELKNMVIVAGLITTAAMIRKESRGTHYREDYPSVNHKDWLRHIYFEQQEKKIFTYCT